MEESFIIYERMPRVGAGRETVAVIGELDLGGGAPSRWRSIGASHVTITRSSLVNQHFAPAM